MSYSVLTTYLECLWIDHPIVHILVHFVRGFCTVVLEVRSCNISNAFQPRSCISSPGHRKIALIGNCVCMHVELGWLE